MPETDVVKQARELLVKATQGPWRAVALLADAEKHHVLAGQFSDQHIRATPDDHNGLVAFADLPANTELIARAPELLNALCNEVERLRGMVYVGEHRHPDLTWESRCVEANTDLNNIRDCDKCDLCEDHHA